MTQIIHINVHLATTVASLWDAHIFVQVALNLWMRIFVCSALIHTEYGEHSEFYLITPPQVVLEHYMPSFIVIEVDTDKYVWNRMFNGLTWCQIPSSSDR